MPAPHLAGRLLAAAVFCSTLPAQAALVHLPGTTVDFYYDNSQPGMAAYGALNAVGDSIFATPSNFYAESLNGGSDNFSALGTVTVVLKSGRQFDSVVVAQEGDYQMIGGGSTVSATATLDVTDSSNAATTVSNALTSTSDFSLQDSSTHAWSSQTSVDLSTALWNSVSSIDLTLDSILDASTTVNGESARIQNKFVGGGMVTVVTTPVPLPASLWLFATGLALLVRRTRQRR